MQRGRGGPGRAHRDGRRDRRGRAVLQELVGRGRRGADPDRDLPLVPGLPPVRDRHEQVVSPWALLAAGAAAWAAAWASLVPFSEAVVRAAGLDRAGRAGGALAFFAFESPKVLLLLSAVVFAMGVVHTFIPPERTRALLSGRRLGAGNVLAAALGVVTPFCSCSAITLFIGFLQAGVPLGVTFSFLISAPMVNEVALVMLFGMLGWKVAALYLALGLTVAVAAGAAIGALGMEDHLEDWVRALQRADAGEAAAARMTWDDRLRAGWAREGEIVGKVWPYILLGVGLGAGIHGYVPEAFLARLMGRGAWWSVPAAVLIGVPMYSNAAGVIPVVQALLSKGAALGTALAFMMSVVALSAPEMIILRKVLKPKLIAAFVGIVSAGILLVGYVFNAVL
ncbi:MAG: permease [Elusimicrobia bacterium]|nr:permease [Elusimicrobiota bacterium]